MVNQEFRVSSTQPPKQAPVSHRFRRGMVFFLLATYALLAVWAALPGFHGHSEIPSKGNLTWNEAQASHSAGADCPLCQWHASAQVFTETPSSAIPFEFTYPHFFLKSPSFAPYAERLGAYSPRGPPPFPV